MRFKNLILAKIKKILKEQNISIYKLESLTGVYTSTISQFLTRKTKTIRIENLLYICEGLDITLSDFFADSRFAESEAKGWIKRNEN